METPDILSTLTMGDCFSVTTEKVIELAGIDRPYTKVLKVSSYAIITGETLKRKLFRPVEPTWWVAVDSKVCKHKRTGNLYVLSMLDKNAGYRRDGTMYYPVDDQTGLIDMEAPFSKADFQWWIPKTAFDGQTFCLPFSSIVELTHSVSREPGQVPVHVPAPAVLVASPVTGESEGTDLPF